MATPKFSDSETELLCRLYMEGRLDRIEEKILFTVLSSRVQCTELMTEVLILMAHESRAFGHDSANMSASKCKLKKYVVAIAAATVAAVTGIGVGMVHNLKSSHDEGIFIVWENGKEITGNEARIQAEESEKIDLEELRKVLRDQRKLIQNTYATINPDEID